jgi:hypothetical protein
VVKDPFAMLSMPAVAASTGATPVLVYRHPAAALASYRRMGWEPDLDELQPLVRAQQAEGHPAALRAGDLPRPGEVSEPEAMGRFWAALYTMALSDVASTPGLLVVSHEEVAGGGRAAARVLFDALDLRWSAATTAEFAGKEPTGAEEAGARLHRLDRDPSTVAGSWRSAVSDDELAAIEAVTEAVRRGLDEVRIRLATPADAPLVAARQRDRSPLPVKLDREEPDYLWGQVRSEFVYQTWIAAGDLVRPGAVFHLVDGLVETERVDDEFSLVSADSAPSLRLPQVLAMKPELALFLQPLPVDTERVGRDMMVLHNRGFRHGIVMLRDTVFLLDATQGDTRARLDSVWIAKLYPTHKAVVVVATDLAWPHIAGMRYWVSRGATVVSHAASRPMLERVLARRWTREPDALEVARRTKPVRFSFVGVKDSLALAGGALKLYPIDGIASEGALMAWSPGDRSLWASDYVQTTSEPAMYTTEVARAAKRVGITPLRVAAEHLAPTDWSKILTLAASP